MLIHIFAHLECFCRPGAAFRDTSRHPPVFPETHSSRGLDTLVLLTPFDDTLDWPSALKLHCVFHHIADFTNSIWARPSFHLLHRQNGAYALFGSQKVIFESHVTFEDNGMEVSHRTYPPAGPVLIQTSVAMM